MPDAKNIISLCTMGNWHFYLKEKNNESVYLSFYLGHNDIPHGKNITFEAPAELRIPIDVWREMIVSWENTGWANDRSMDNTTISGRALVEEFFKKKK